MYPVIPDDVRETFGHTHTHSHPFLPIGFVFGSEHAVVCSVCGWCDKSLSTDQGYAHVVYSDTLSLLQWIHMVQSREVVLNIEHHQDHVFDPISLHMPICAICGWIPPGVSCEGSPELLGKLFSFISVFHSPPFFHSHAGRYLMGAKSQY